MNGGAALRFRSLVATDETIHAAPFKVAQHLLGRVFVPDLDRLVAVFHELGFELGRLRAGEGREQVPVLLGHELPDLHLAIADQLERYRLHPSRAEAATDLVPQQRADLVAHEAIEHASRLLRVDHLHVDRAGVFDGLEHRFLGDLVEHQAVDLLFFGSKLFGEVPADGLALSIGVGRDVDVGGVLSPPTSARRSLSCASRGARRPVRNPRPRRHRACSSAGRARVPSTRALCSRVRDIC
jgi:hypothetical protein